MASPSNSKAGPIKAVHQTFGLTVSSGSSYSPTSQIVGVENQNQSNFKIKRLSPDSPLQPGSPVSKDRKGATHGLGISRTGSFDVLSSSCYINGEWPRLSSPLINQMYLTLEKSTQTPDEWYGLHSLDQLSKTSGSLKVSTTLSSSGSLKDIRALLSKSSKERESPMRPSVSSSQRTSPVTGSRHGVNSNSVQTKPIPVPFLSRSRSVFHCFGSLESLNQEIEKLVMHSSSQWTEHAKSPSDGRRAPVPCPLTTCSRLTQTPPQGPAMMMIRVTPVLGTPDDLDDRPMESSCQEENFDCEGKEFLDSGSGSPELLHFLSPKTITSRMPPDGCEKVEGIFQEYREIDLMKREVPFFKQQQLLSGVKCHIPSESSAFNPLVKNYLRQPVDLALKFGALAVSPSQPGN